MATRDLSADLKTALAANTAYPLIFAELNFSASVYRLWNGRGIKSWNGYSWTGSGLFVRAGEVGETQNERDIQFTVTLEGVSGLFPSVVLNQAQQNKLCKIWFGLADSAGDVVVDPYLAYRGYLDTVSIDHSAEGSLVTLTYQSENGLLDKASGQRYTDATQQYYYPNDVGFQYVANIENWNGYWGQPE